MFMYDLWKLTCTHHHRRLQQMLILHRKRVYRLILQHWQVDWYLIWSHRHSHEFEIHDGRWIAQSLLVRHIAGPDGVPSNVSVRIHRQLHQVGRTGRLLNAARVDIKINSELFEVGIGRLHADRDGAGERAETVHRFLLDSLRPVHDSRRDARLAGPKIKF